MSRPTTPAAAEEGEEESLWERIVREVAVDYMIDAMRDEELHVISPRDGGRLEALLFETGSKALAKKSKNVPRRLWTVKSTLSLVDHGVYEARRRWLCRRRRLLERHVDPALKRFRDAVVWPLEDRRVPPEVTREMRRSHLEILDDAAICGSLAGSELDDLADTMAAFSFAVLGWRAARPPARRPGLRAT